MTRKPFFVVFGLIVLFLSGVFATPGTQSVSAQDSTEPEVPWFQASQDGVYIVSTTEEVAAILNADGEEVRVTGRVSFNLSGSLDEIREGSVVVSGFSMAFFGVPQQALARGIETDMGNGVLGFAADTREPQRLEVDARSGVIVGEIRGYVDASYMASLIVGPAMDGRNDLFETATQPATLFFEMQMSPRVLLAERDTPEVDSSEAQISIKIAAESIAYEEFELAPFELAVQEELTGVVNVIAWRFFEVAKQLCIQPVRIGRFRFINRFPWGSFYFTIEYTGDGLAFGQPRANALWRKADVVFDYRNWKTVWDSGYWVVDTNGAFTSTEQADLKAEVTDSDCIEVFFIDEFDPESWGGGGATWGSGTAGSQVITSDANADGGIDLTHLAHELGHVMSLPHPTGAPGVSTGTLMCPSGYLNDNPNVQSQENADNVSNPLFIYTFRIISAGPDCQDSADCGACS